MAQNQPSLHLTPRHHDAAAAGAEPKTTHDSSKGLREILLPTPLILRLLTGLTVVFVIAAVCGAFMMEPLEKIGVAAVDQFGLLGVFLAILLIDSAPTPLSYAPLLLLAIQGGLSIWVVLVVGSVASMSGGVCGYWIGRSIGMPTRLESWLHANYPEQFDLLKTYGALGVAAIAALPLPFAIGTWSAGAMGVRFFPVLIASLVRIPKTGIYIALILSGLQFGGAQ